MTQIEFESAVDNIRSYFQKAKPTEASGRLWYQEVRNIPSEALEYITRKVYQTKYPDNFPKTFWGLYHAWLQENPHKQDHGPGECIDCDGSGWISARKIGERNWTGFRCGNCQPEGQHTLYNLISRGFEVHWSHYPTPQIKEMPEYARGRRFIKSYLKQPHKPTSGEPGEARTKDLEKKVQTYQEKEIVESVPF